MFRGKECGVHITYTQLIWMLCWIQRMNSQSNFFTFSQSLTSLFSFYSFFHPINVFSLFSNLSRVQSIDLQTLSPTKREKQNIASIHKQRLLIILLFAIFRIILCENIWLGVMRSNHCRRVWVKVMCSLCVCVCVR
jgi:hypothetical protein